MIMLPHTYVQSRSPRIKAFLATGLLVSLSSVFQVYSANAQAPAPVVTQPAALEPGLQRHPTGIEDAQPDPHEEYLLGAGDDIVVTVAGRPELSGAHIVGPDGRITLPVVGTVNVGEKSRDDAAKSIDDTLGKYYSGSMSSTVEVTKYGSNHILLLGAIEKPGLITFDQPPSLLEAITKGGAVVNADKSGSDGSQVPSSIAATAR